MSADAFRLSFGECRDLLEKRLAEPAPSRVQLLTGPRQVGKTTLLLDLARRNHDVVVYGAADAPEATLPGFWERLWTAAQATATRAGAAVLLLDEVQRFDNWASV